MTLDTHHVQFDKFVEFGELYKIGQCVFGKVIKGMDIVKAVEAKGSQSGKTSAQCTITDCGQIA